MKKQNKENFKLFEEVDNEELKENGGVGWTVTIPISMAVCPSITCPSITKPCNK